LLENRQMLAGELSAALVADIVPGTVSSNPHQLTAVNGTLYFGATDPASGLGVWKSDGTAAGTTLVKTVAPVGAAATDFTPVAGNVFFEANGSRLWKTDGTTAGTAELKLVWPDHLTAMNGKLFFSGTDTQSGRELWVSDGTTAGTKVLKDIFPGKRWVYDGRDREMSPYDSNPAELTNLNGTLLFTATTATSGRELWRSDGTSKGTALVKDIAPGSASSSPQNLMAVGASVYFTAAGGLWKTNGTSAGTVLVKAVAAANLTNVNGVLFFTGPGGLWKSDGSGAGTVLIHNVAATNLSNVNGMLYFTGTTGAAGAELWRSDGTATGTVLVKDINPGSPSSAPTQLINVNGRLYFAANDGVNGNELWQSDGTETGTVIVQDIHPGSTNSDPTFLTSMNNKLYFAATDPVHGRELWDPPPVEPSPDGSYLLVTNLEKHNVLRYDAVTGAFVDEFVTRGSGELNFPWAAVFGPEDGELYVSSGHRHSKGEGATKAVLRYDGDTGAFQDEFVGQGQMFLVHAVTFGPDGNIYVGEKKVLTPGNPHQRGGRIMRFDGQTGEFMDEFVPVDSGGLKHPAAHVFGPDGAGGLDLYVSDEGPSRILRYDGETGAFIEEFVTGGAGGLSLPNGVIFGPDGDLYVASFGSGSVMRFQGPSSSTPGAPFPVSGNRGADFVAAGAGGLLSPTGILFGPDGNGDGNQDLYVTNVHPTNVQGKLGNVKRYDGVTGAFIDTFVTARSGGLDDPSLMTFTETDPVTLVYRGGDNLTAAAIAPDSMSQTLIADQVQLLLTEALTLSQAAGVDISAVSTIDIHIADLDGRTLGLVAGHTIWLDAGHPRSGSAAGWGWYLDPTPGDDFEFSTPGDQGEQGRMESFQSRLHRHRVHRVGRRPMASSQFQSVAWI